MLKLGQKLIGKNSGRKHHIASASGEVYFIIADEGKSEGFCFGPYTEQGVLNNFDILKEHWEPQLGERYWIVGHTGIALSQEWVNDSADMFRRDYLGIFKTREECEEYRNNMKKISL